MLHLTRVRRRTPLPAEPDRRRGTALLALWFWLVFAAGLAGVCQGAVGDWTTHVNSDSLCWVHFDGTYVWCASNGGAVIFEPGVEQFTKTLRNGPGTLVNNDISCVAVSDGQMAWFGTSGFGLSLLHEGGWTLFTEGITLLPSNDILSLRSSGSSLWAGTRQGLALFQGSSLDATFDVSSTGGGIPNDVINDILATADTVWCATDGGVGMGVLSAGAWTWQALNSGLASLNVLCVGRLAGRVWVGIQDNVYSYSTYEYDGSAWVKMGASLSWAPVALQEMGGDLYVAGSASGVFVWETSAWVDKTPSSVTGSFIDLTSDGAGTLWCATSEGLVSYDGTDWRQFTPPGPQYDYVQDFSASPAGKMWAAIRSFPAALRLDGLEWTLFDNSTSGGGFQDATLFSVLASASGTVWFGHCCHVTCRADKLDYADGAEVWSNHYFNNSKDITEDVSGTVWFSSEGHGIYAFDPSTSSERNIDYTEGKLSSSSVEFVAPVDARRRWIGHMLNGVDFWDDLGTADESDDVWKHFETDDGLLSLSVTSGAIAGNKVYVGTGKGVTVFQDTVWLRNYGASDLVHDGVAVSSTVNDVAVDSRGNVWVATTGGVAEIAPSGDVAATFTYASSGLVGDEVLCVAVDETRGEVWFGTRKGMSVLEAWNPSEGKSLADAYVYPNPFRPLSGHQDIRIDGLPVPVMVSVYDLTGRMLRYLGTVGNGEKVWDGTDANGRAVSTGVYLLRLEASNASSVKKVAVIR
ncbi:MAG: T9SS type A sorting domain-containing protein [Candidatus Eisenbacteria bacterium]|nr:T9SS type A sorting domain-containing protein [Candidatus Eisenbacteria bacterium]